MTTKKADETHNLPCDLTEEERRLLGDQIALACATIDQHKSTTKEIVAQRKGDLDRMESQLKTDVAAQTTGVTTKPVVCHWRLEENRTATGHVWNWILYRGDTGVVIHSQPAAADDLQTNLLPEDTDAN